ncbi:Hypp9760 [Branchiostoma lanceolatum]|uniref:Hypp9760 protein n=1 Tax=Branchiostoma lanceolatum TaxID=7740 RepID=A0A8S4MPS3_BRALA|nr:Hypp9760 [Branchiostoma lanceolatum]
MRRAGRGRGETPTFLLDCLVQRDSSSLEEKVLLEVGVCPCLAHGPRFARTPVAGQQQPDASPCGTVPPSPGQRLQVGSSVKRGLVRILEGVDRKQRGVWLGAAGGVSGPGSESSGAELVEAVVAERDAAEALAAAGVCVANDREADLEAALLREELSSKIGEVEKSYLNCKHGRSWKLINDITDRKTTRKGQLEGSTQEERIENWYNHFNNLLGDSSSITDEGEKIPSVFEEIDIKEGPFEQEEYEGVKKLWLKERLVGKMEYLQKFERVLMKGEKPGRWSLLNIVPIPESGNLRLGSNYRGISLSSLVAKTFNRMILNRIRPAVDELLRCNQNGFREERSTVAHILALRRLIEGITSHNLPTSITYIDFRKAFDLDSQRHWQSVRRYKSKSDNSRRGHQAF